MNFLWFKIIYKSHLIDTLGDFLQILLLVASLILLLTGDICYNISVFWNLVHLFVNPAYNLTSYPKYDLCHLSEVGSIHPSQTVWGCASVRTFAGQSWANTRLPPKTFLSSSGLSSLTRLAVWDQKMSLHMSGPVLWLFLVEGLAQFSLLHQSQTRKSLPLFLFTLFLSPFHFFLFRCYPFCLLTLCYF